MIYLIAWLLVSAFVVYKFCDGRYGWEWQWEVFTMAPLMVALMMILPVAGVILGVDIYAEHHAVTYDQNRQLQALSTGQSMQGSFFLGSGTVNENPVYFYYEKDDNGDYRMDYVEAEYAVIREDAEADTARLTYTCDWVDMNDFFTYPFNGGGEYWKCDTDYVFHVPPGSVAYNVDLSLPGS